MKAELPQLKRFATLSPVPGFRAWLDGQFDAEAPVLSEEEVAALGVAPGLGPREALAAATAGEWWHDAGRVRALRGPLLRLVAGYLTRGAQGGEKIDPVGAVSFGQWGAAGAGELVGECFQARHAGILRGDGELCV